MHSIDRQAKLSVILKALKMRIYLSFGFGYSTLFPRRDVLLIRADKIARRRGTFIQRLPARVIILATVGTFCYFFVSQNSVGLMSVLYLLPPIIIPLAALLGALITTSVDSIDVRLRREYARLSTALEPSLADSGFALPKNSIEERMRDRRANGYRENRRLLQRSRNRRIAR